jgi:hypothetical protein
MKYYIRGRRPNERFKEPRITTLILLIALSCPGSLAQSNGKPAAATMPKRQVQVEQPETPHLAFVTEYVRELSAIEDLRAKGERETKRDQETKEDQLATFLGMVHSSTLFQLEIGSQIRTLKQMRLNDPFDTLIPTITRLYESKIEIWRRMNEVATAFIAAPQPGVDYGKLTAEIPQLRARMEYLDHTLFEATPLVFETLIDLQPNSHIQADHLIITKAEKLKLIDDLDTAFGSKLDQKNQNYSVSSAIVLRDALRKDYKCSDEP